MFQGDSISDSAYLRRRERTFDKFSRNTARLPPIETEIKIGHDDVKRFEKVLFIIVINIDTRPNNPGEGN